MFIHKNVLLAILCTVVLILTGVSAYAGMQPNETSTTIYGCVEIKKAALRIVEAGTACSKGESPISWNIAGPKGDKGDIGPTGPQGPQGMSLVDFSGGNFYTPNVPLDTSSNTMFSITIPKGGVYRLDLLSNTTYAGTTLYRSSISATISGASIPPFYRLITADIKYDPKIPSHYNSNFTFIDTRSYSSDLQCDVSLDSDIFQQNAPATSATVVYQYALTKL